MSHVAYHSHGGESEVSLKGSVSFFAKLVDAVVRRVQLRRTQLHLEGMDDRLLNDIGLERADIHSAVWRGRKLSR